LNVVLEWVLMDQMPFLTLVIRVHDFVVRVAHKKVGHFILLPTRCIPHTYWKFL